jgi:3-deoxy-manno-octulosonate cytidylyltransferase (CMP-KDO synthetase)
MLEYVWRGARASARLTRLIVATEDERIVEACARFGGEAMLTDPAHPSGSDRVAEVAARTGPWDVVLNIQGDEPFVTGTCLDRLVETLGADPGLSMATLSEPFDDKTSLDDPNAVKVVCALDGKALYFSRSPIPFDRAGTASLELWRKHQGLYAYRAKALFEITALPPSPLERAESLEQLRALQAGYSIAVLPSDFRSIAVDTPADLARAEARLSTLEEAGR